MLFKQKQRIWVLEDNSDTVFVYKQILDVRYVVTYFTTISEFQDKLLQATDMPELIVADLSLEDGNLLNAFTSPEFSAALRIPFIVVSSMDDIDALRFCYEKGALDYLIKPFKKNELLVKIEQLLLKTNSIKTSLAKNSLRTVNGSYDFEDLTLKESMILSLFFESASNRLTRNEILSKVWKGVKVQDKTVDVHLHNLRKKIVSHGMNIVSAGPGEWAFQQKVATPSA